MEEVDNMKHESRLDHFYEQYKEKKHLKKVRHVQKGAACLVQHEEKKKQDKSYKVSDKEMRELLRFMNKIKKQDMRCYVEYQQRLQSLTGLSVKTLQKKANRLLHEHKFHQPKNKGLDVDE
jgi:hypothetical protein